MTWLVVHALTGERRRLRNDEALREWSVLRERSPAGWWRVVEITAEPGGVERREVPS